MSDSAWEGPKAVPDTPAEPVPAPEPAKEEPAVAEEEAVVNPPGAGRPASAVVEETETEVDESWPKYKVEPPLESFTYHGHVVGLEPTPLDPAVAGLVVAAAREVGTELTLVEE